MQMYFKLRTCWRLLNYSLCRLSVAYHFCFQAFYLLSSYYNEKSKAYHTKSSTKSVILMIYNQLKEQYLHCIIIGLHLISPNALINFPLFQNSAGLVHLYTKLWLVLIPFGHTATRKWIRYMYLQTVFLE